MQDALPVFIGYDPREEVAYDVARWSILRRTSRPVRIIPIRQPELRAAGIYRRAQEIRDGRLWDVISDAPMSTEFAITRFLVPLLCPSGWSIFVDADVLFLADVAELFSLADPRFAVMCVKHNHAPLKAEKMDGQIQTTYPMKNWSSVMLFNADHVGNRGLTTDLINSVPGRDLHRFCWLESNEIGELPAEWNYLVGNSKLQSIPKIVHYTDGIPEMSGYEECDLAGMWNNERDIYRAAHANYDLRPD